jgi:integrase
MKDAKTRKRKSSLRDDRQMLGVNEDGTLKADKNEAQKKKRILTVLGEQRLAEIKQSDIAQFHESLRKAPYRANRMLALLSAVFNYGIDKKWTTENPARGIKKFHEEKRERFLTIEEMQKLRESIEGYHDEDDVSARNALLLLMLTGSREGEVLKAEWEEFDLQRGVWTKPSHHTKQKKDEHIPLSGPALKLLESMMPMNATGPLFPGLNGEARTTLRRPWVQACKAAGLVKEDLIDGKRKGKDGEPETLTRYRPTLRIHDLRHNFASHLASNGVSLQVVGKLLGHTQASTTMRYAHLQDEALRVATNKFGRIFEQAPKAGKRRA